jgi:hypothetical protein
VVPPSLPELAVVAVSSQAATPSRSMKLLALEVNVVIAPPITDWCLSIVDTLSEVV